MITIPLIEFLVTMPISIGGIGVRDSAFVFLLVPLGLTTADALSYSLLSFVVSTVVSILSGITFLFEYDNSLDLRAKSVERTPKPL
jgi:hypothetical protein